MIEPQTPPPEKVQPDGQKGVELLQILKILQNIGVFYQKKIGVRLKALKEDDIQQKEAIDKLLKCLSACTIRLLSVLLDPIKTAQVMGENNNAMYLVLEETKAFASLNESAELLEQVSSTV